MTKKKKETVQRVGQKVAYSPKDRKNWWDDAMHRLIWTLACILASGAYAFILGYYYALSL